MGTKGTAVINLRWKNSLETSKHSL